MTDVSVQTSMKGAAKCDKHCELQNSVNQQDSERLYHFRDMLGSMPASELILLQLAKKSFIRSLALNDPFLAAMRLSMLQ